jgi:signal transduction histidine kinase
MLERAFENVVRNALEAASPSGRIGVQVEGPMEGRLVVRVVDDGPGLAAGFDVPRPFQTTKAGGLGLGLPMAVKIVALHGGDIRLLGRTPRGVEVVIRLPVGGPPE